MRARVRGVRTCMSSITVFAADEAALAFWTEPARLRAEQAQRMHYVRHGPIRSQVEDHPAYTVVHPWPHSCQGWVVHPAYTVANDG